MMKKVKRGKKESGDFSLPCNGGGNNDTQASRQTDKLAGQ